MLFFETLTNLPYAYFSYCNHRRWTSINTLPWSTFDYPLWPFPHRSPIWWILQLHSSITKYLPTTYYDVQKMRIFSSSVLTFLPVIACYLSIRRTDALLQRQSWSTQWHQHSEIFPIFYYCDNIQSHHTRPTRVLIDTLTNNRFHHFVHLRHCQPSPPFSHTRSFLHEKLPIFLPRHI